MDSPMDKIYTDAITEEDTACARGIDCQPPWARASHVSRSVATPIHEASRTPRGIQCRWPFPYQGAAASSAVRSQELSVQATGALRGGKRQNEPLGYH
jgi:hypothetical protein